MNEEKKMEEIQAKKIANMLTARLPFLEIMNMGYSDENTLSINGIVNYERAEVIVTPESEVYIDGKLEEDVFEGQDVWRMKREEIK